MIEFFFDCSSPWTYLAFHNIAPLAREFGEGIEWRPILVGGIFNTINPSVYQSREKPVAAKARYYKKDLSDWARSAGLEIKIRPSVFPVNSVKAMRGCIYLQPEGKLVAFARAVFESYWRDDQDISRDEVLAAICATLDVDPQRFFAGIAQQGIKDKLRANTDELIARGGFGSPTIYLDRDDMYFGNDRLPLLRIALERRAALAGQHSRASRGA
jgi:2-hydroxychromene-2-carboxylate isomerase